MLYLMTANDFLCITLVNWPMKASLIPHSACLLTFLPLCTWWQPMLSSVSPSWTDQWKLLLHHTQLVYLRFSLYAVLDDSQWFPLYHPRKLTNESFSYPTLGLSTYVSPSMYLMAANAFLCITLMNWPIKASLTPHSAGSLSSWRKEIQGSLQHSTKVRHSCSIPVYLHISLWYWNLTLKCYKNERSFEIFHWTWSY